MNLHPLSQAFPRMTDDEFIKLVASVEKVGLLDPITTLDGQILDGRHRFNACIKAGVEPTFVELGADIDPVDYVIAKNSDRRHLTTVQKAKAGVAVKEYEAERAKERQGTRTDLVETIPQSDGGKARDLAGAKVGVSGKSIDAIERIVRDASREREDDPLKERAQSVLRSIDSGAIKSVSEAVERVYGKPAGGLARGKGDTSDPKTIEQIREKLYSDFEKATNILQDIIIRIGEVKMDDDLRYCTARLRHLLEDAERELA